MAILDQDTNTSPTMDQALGFVEGKADTFEAWRRKGLGLQLVLMGLAEVQALRMSKIVGMVMTLENKLMNKNILEGLEPKQLLSLYRMSTEALDNSSSFVERTVKSVNWKEMEDQLLEITAAGGKANTDLSIHETAGDLLSILARAQAASQSDDEG